ncbi:lanthionine synthetase C family protein [Micromonospora sp. CPCC 205539]|uniref:lanthionine synthetase C family protein n=1 Tax=Micromonospora sp. CPCC 205539 TaxID=3122408 RepID=UPI002FEF35AE
MTTARTVPPWTPPVTQGTARRAREVALAVAAALRDRAGPALPVPTPPEGGSGTGGSADDAWRPSSLASGYPGLALLAAYLDECRPGDGWARTGHLALTASVRDEAELTRLGPSLYTGWGGLAVAATALARSRPRYGAFLASADSALSASAAALVHEVSTNDPPFRPPLIDLITGLAGVTVALLARRGTPAVDAVLPEALAALATLAEPDASNGGHPRLVAPPQWGALRLDGGHPLLNLGLAHGLPGVLATLSLALSDGAGGDAEAAAVATLAQWLRRYRRIDRWGPVWPNGVSVDPTASMPPPGRMAWCYGTAGCTRALWLAGRALDREQWRDEAVDAIRGALRRPPSERGLSSPTFCHGQAGLLHIALRFAGDTGDDEICAAIDAEVVRLIDAYEPTSAYGYQRVESGAVPSDSAGLLDGAAGVALVLLAASGDQPPTWDRIFLVA